MIIVTRDPRVGMLERFRRSDGARRFGKRIEKSVKGFLVSATKWLGGGREPMPLSAVDSANRTVIVRPNFRIGNTVISTPLIEAVHDRFGGGGGRLDYVAADTTAALLENFPLDHVYTVSRHFMWNPLACFKLIRTLRRVRYDAAIDGGRGSLTSALITGLTGARFRIGRGRWVGSLLNVDIGDAGGRHVYEKEAALARAFSEAGDGRPRCILTDEERLHARHVLGEAGHAPGGPSFLALYVGGHLSKRWPGDCWIELVRRLAPSGVRMVVFAGPEETELCAGIRGMRLPNVRAVPVQTLRVLAACSAGAALAVSPDTGPMHLAAAVGVPVIAVLQTERSMVYAPRGENDRVLMNPSVADVAEALTGHPAWATISPN